MRPSTKFLLPLLRSSLRCLVNLCLETKWRHDFRRSGASYNRPATNTVQLRGRTTSRDTRKLYYVSHPLILQGIQEVRAEERAQQN
jgi:hypothetical protein